MRRLLTFSLAVCLAACSVALPASTQPSGGTPGIGASSTPLAWAALGLSGKLILIVNALNGPAIISMDLISGNSSPIYQADQGALLSSALVSPDGKQVLITYAPPATSQNQFSYTSVYLMPIDGSKDPHPLFASASTTDAYFAPTWAPDGKSIYTSHYHKGSDPNGADDTFTIDQVTLDGQARAVIRNGQWPRLSPDEKRIAYVTASPNSGQADLYQAGVDGNNITPVIKSGTFQAVDDHFYTPDGQSIIFSAVNPAQPAPTQTSLERFLGITIAAAHNIPSDWYEAPAGGGEPKRLTNLEDTGMFASLSPDRDWIAFIGVTGTYVMKVDGTRLTQLDGVFGTGTVDWIR
jgi:Tol biopolymer transport system component